MDRAPDMKVLVACEFSGTVRRAFAARGHFSVSCDLLPADDGSNNHWQGDVFDCLETLGPFDLMVAHPPCTYLTNAGVRHLFSVPSAKGRLPKMHGAERWKAMLAACAFFNALRNAPATRIAIENPVPHGYARDIIGPYDQLVQPWQHGHGETKATCLWLKGLPLLRPSNIVPGREHRIHRMPPSADRWKARSITYAGIAQAMADQWG